MNPQNEWLSVCKPDSKNTLHWWNMTYHGINSRKLWSATRFPFHHVMPVWNNSPGSPFIKWSLMKSFSDYMINCCHIPWPLSENDILPYVRKMIMLGYQGFLINQKIFLPLYKVLSCNPWLKSYSPGKSSDLISLWINISNQINMDFNYDCLTYHAWQVLSGRDGVVHLSQ